MNFHLFLGGKAFRAFRTNEQAFFLLFVTISQMSEIGLSTIIDFIANFAPKKFKKGFLVFRKKIYCDFLKFKLEIYEITPTKIKNYSNII